MHNVGQPGTRLAVTKSDSATGLYYYRARYYDPAVGRFSSEDPIGFASEMDFYSYVRNNPTYLIDPRGLQAAIGEPAKPGVNTIVCNGSGGIRIQIGGPPPPQAKCAEECMLLHERRHIRDVTADNPRVCEGVPDGIKVGFSHGSKQEAATEIAASNIEIECLKKLKNKKGSCDTCNQDLIDKRIAQMRRYRDGFKSQ